MRGQKMGNRRGAHAADDTSIHKDPERKEALGHYQSGDVVEVGTDQGWALGRILKARMKGAGGGVVSDLTMCPLA